LRKSLENDKNNIIKYRLLSLVEKLLPILDSYEIVLKASPDDEKIKNYLVGFGFLFKNLLTVLEEDGLTRITPEVGSKFNYHEMEAVETTIDNEHPDVIKAVELTGYKLYDRIIRPAKVVVTITEADQKEVNKGE
ncbi:MAG: nucleotide exchange factor GrpE, partial [Erysipelotrichaceae bacterium]|nr:nucleotide exchange factor GrpE [Erysipelotrichaceae bacterium]